jgi:hypothetical protein
VPHTCSAVVVGGQATAELRITKSDMKNLTDMKADFFGNISCGPINASTRAHLEWLDSEEGSDYETVITLLSQPHLGNPHTVHDMFQLVDEMEERIKGELYMAPLFAGKVFGVPIQFTLVPLGQYLTRTKVEKRYHEIEEHNVESLRTMFGFLRDYSVRNFIIDKVVARERTILRLTQDAQSPLTKQIVEYEESLRKEATSFLERGAKLLVAYKQDKPQTDITELMSLVNEWYRSECSISSVEARTASFITSGNILFIFLNVFN